MKRATIYSAGYDLTTPIDFILKSKHKINIDTKLYYPDLPSDTYGHIKSRSGLYFKNEISVFEGIIDSDYKNSIIVGMHNGGEEDHSFKKGDKIAQIIFNKYITITDEINHDQLIRKGGFGSTDYFL